MRQLVICTEDFPLCYTSCLDFGNIHLANEHIYYALIERESITLDAEKKPYHVLVQKKAFSCNYRDVGIIVAANTKVKNASSINNVSYYPIASEFSGVVVSIGKNVTTLKIGDRVIADASYPTTLSMDIAPGLPTNHGSSELELIHERKLIKIPDTMPFEIGAAFTIGAQTTYSMLNKLNIQEGERILITGLPSNTALFALNALKNKNVEVYGLARKNTFEDKLFNLGLKKLFVVNESTENLIEDEHIKNHIKQYGKFNCIIDPFSDSYLFKVLDTIAIEGRYITCGIANQFHIDKTHISLNRELAKIITNNITIYGNCLGKTEHLIKALNDFSNGQLEVQIDKIISNDVQKFMNRSFLSKEKFGKVVFKYE